MQLTVWVSRAAWYWHTKKLGLYKARLYKEEKPLVFTSLAAPPPVQIMGDIDALC